MNLSLVARADSIARCALCHDDALDAPLLCPDCHTVVHAECRVRAPCPTLGCKYARPQEAAPRERVVFLRPSVRALRDHALRLGVALVIASAIGVVLHDCLTR